MEFPRRGYWNGPPFPSPGDLPHPGINPPLLHWQLDSLPLSHLRVSDHCLRKSIKVTAESGCILSETGQWRGTRETHCEKSKEWLDGNRMLACDASTCCSRPCGFNPTNQNRSWWCQVLFYITYLGLSCSLVGDSEISLFLSRLLRLKLTTCRLSWTRMKFPWMSSAIGSLMMPASGSLPGRDLNWVMYLFPGFLNLHQAPTAHKTQCSEGSRSN